MPTNIIGGYKFFKYHVLTPNTEQEHKMILEKADECKDVFLANTTEEIPEELLRDISAYCRMLVLYCLKKGNVSEEFKKTMDTRRHNIIASKKMSRAYLRIHLDGCKRWPEFRL